MHEEFFKYGEASTRIQNMSTYTYHNLHIYEEFHNNNKYVRMSVTTNMYKILVGIPLGKGSLGSLRSKWEGNIKINFK
jgi:hypothetical protein